MADDLKTVLYPRFERYVKVETTSDDSSPSCPSTPGQLRLARIAAEDMKKAGLKNVSVDKNGYVMGELAANSPKRVPAVGFIAHLDTAPDAPGKNVRPQLHPHYSGGDIVVNKKLGVVIRPQDAPGLADCAGEDIITASGDTLLGADNKAGMAVILSALEWLHSHPEVKHGPLKAAFTPDEEIGRGADRFDLKRFGAKVAYTFDGDRTGSIEDETFNADGLTLCVKGKSVHTGSAKNILANAVRISADIISSWPVNLLPETTEGREGFVVFLSSTAGMEKAEVKGLVREHDLARLRRLERLLEAIVAQKRLEYPAAEIALTFREQYRNMKQVLDKHPLVMRYALEAMRETGVEPIIKPVRGGTDGARLSFMGLPTPNIFTGGGNYHGRHEWVSLDGMAKAARVLIALARKWEENS